MKTNETIINKIRILVIGNTDFIQILKESKTIHQLQPYTFEVISDQKSALERLNHNSYDILLLQDKFSKYQSIYLSTLAYAMCRPTLIICNSWFKVFKYLIWRIFSTFSRKYKLSRKLIHFVNLKSDYSKQLTYLAKNHLQYFDKINKEISKNTKF